MLEKGRLSGYVKGIYRFLPVQLFLLHFRKYEFLLIFWIIVIATITGHFAASFGASSLFLSPEYRGTTNFISMLLLGGAMSVFVMAWHITTFIIHSHRVPFMGAIRHAFLKYCINNSVLPLSVLVFYSYVSIKFQWVNERASLSQIIEFQTGFYLGFMIVILLSFLYFFRVDRDLLKVVLSRITNPARIKEIIPYDSLDYEIDIIRAETYLSGKFKVRKCSELEPYHPRLLQTVLRKHHRNAITATFFAILILLLSGIFMDDPRLRIPAGAGFLILFSIIMGITGAMKYLLRSWEVLGWALVIIIIGFLVKQRVFDLRSRAYGIDYHTAENTRPVYDYNNLKKIFTPELYEADKRTEEKRLDSWNAKQTAKGNADQPMIVITVSGGGSRSALWTFNSLQYLDSMTNGLISSNTVLLTGASGGMIGATYWRELHNAYAEKRIEKLYSPAYQENISKDLLNAIVFSFASVDLISPFNKISLAGRSYTKDRGYAMEQELIRNTDGLLDKKIGDYTAREAAGELPLMVINSTIINDGRKLMMAGQPISYLTRPEYGLTDTANPAIDAVDFGTFFKQQNPSNLRLTTALRMNATFPYILPVVKLPSQPYMNTMDAGLRDNFGIEVAMRYVYAMRHWIKKNNKQVIYLEIRDTREQEVFPPTEMNTFGQMVSDPVFVIQNKWEPFQSYYHSYTKDMAPYFLDGNMKFISLQYMPQDNNKPAALNFHLTKKEKDGIKYAIYNPQNQRAVDTLLKLLQPAAKQQ
jgi:CBS-domain-containing membrane protein